MVKLIKKFSLTVSIAALVVMVGFSSLPRQLSYATPSPATISQRIATLSGIAAEDISEMYAVEQMAKIVIIASDINIPIVVEPMVGYLLIKDASTGLWTRLIIDLAEWKSDFRPYFDENGIEVLRQPFGTIDELTAAQEAAQVAAVASMTGVHVVFLIQNGAPRDSVQSAPSPATNPNPAPSSASDRVGTTEGRFRVNEAGAATYSIEIGAAAGTAGVAPSVALNYSSNGRNGIAGFGWGISGLSAISRCRQTLDQDRQALPITFGSDDRFCLDGQRLLLVDGSSYGALGSTYRPEIDSGVRVKAVGNTDGEPNSFEVRRKDGSVAYYGGSSDSEIGGGSDKTLTWGIRRFEDNVGNPIVFEYETSATALRVSAIKYAYGRGSAANASITFEYEDRDDPLRGYVAGYEFVNDQRLTFIRSHNTVQGQNHTIREYKLEYADPQSVTTDDLSRLVSIEECAGGVCLPKTTFDWRLPANNSYLALQSTIDLAESSDLRDLTIADINGDGLMDLAWLEGSTTGNANLNFAISDGVRLTQTPFSNGSLEYAPSGSADKLTAIDYNLDGRNDIAYWDENASRWKVIIAVPRTDGSWRLENQFHLTPIDDEDVTFVDVDSDGATDAVWATGTGTGSKQLKLSRLVKNPSRQPSSSTYYHFGAPVNVGLPSSHTKGDIQAVAADFDGDGRVGIITGEPRIICEMEQRDRVFCPGPKHAYALNIDNPTTGTPGYTTYSSLNNQGPIVSNEHVRVQGIVATDVNVDGLSDLFYPVYRNPDEDIGQYHLAINKGDGSFAVIEYFESTMNDGDARAPQFVDWNGDGHQDLMWKSTEGNGTVYVRYWNPSTQRLEPKVTAADASNSLSESVYFPDINGDGVSDFVKIDRGNGRGTVRMYTRRAANAIANQGANRINKITNGLGAVTQVSYEPLTTTSNYERLELGTTTGSATFCEREPGFEFCFDSPVQVPNTAAFYSSINSNTWNLPEEAQSLIRQSPVLEFIGPYYVAVQVRGSAPAAHPTQANTVNANATSSVQYRYHEAKIQAAGRGFLGFEQLTTIDDQTGVETTTRYRQDWPFIGRPLGSVARTSNDTVLKTGSTEWEMLEWSSDYTTIFNSNGSAEAGPVQIISSASLENTFALSQGTSLGSVGTATQFDADGNATEVEVSHNDASGSNVQTVRTVNTFFNASNSVFELWGGRLKSTSVTTTRAGLPPGPSRVSTFSYYTDGEQGGFEGMLKAEVLEPDDDDFRLTTTHKYDVHGNLRRSTATDGSTTRCDVDIIEYDSIGRYASKEFGCLGNLISQIVERSPFGSVKHAIGYVDQNVPVSTFESFGALGRSYFSYSPSGASSQTYFSTSTANCPSSAVMSSTTTEATGAQSSVCFDVLGRPVRELTRAFDGTLNAKDTEYDEIGRVYRQSKPFNLTYDGSVANYWTKKNYDILGRVIATESPGVASIGVEYLGLEVRTTVNSSPARVKREISNIFGEVTDTFDSIGGHTQYDYDVHGNLVYVADTDGNVTRSQFDKLGRKEWTDDPNKGRWNYEYTNYGELNYQKDAKGQITVTEYDSLGRVSGRTDKLDANDEGNLTTWHYDSAQNGHGQVAYVTDHSSGYTKTYSYDNLGRADLITTSFNGSTFAELTTFDQYGRIFQYFDAAGDGAFENNGVVSLYNSFGYLTQVADAVVQYGQSREIYRQIESMNARGQVTVEKRGITPNSTTASATITYAYSDATGLIRDIDANNRYGDDIQDLSYLWDEVGNLTQRKEKSGSKDLTEGFTYDVLNRLKTFGAGIDSVSVTYTPDKIGNIDFYTKRGHTYSYSYDGPNGGPHAVTTFDGKTLKYDANGNNYETRKANGSVERSILYTTFDKPGRIDANNHRVEFDYSPDRTRFRRIDTDSDGQTVTMYVGAVEIINRPDGTQERKRYIGGAAIETTKYSGSGNATSRVTNYLFNDHLGSLDVITGGDGAIVQELSFDAWGQKRNPTNWLSLSSTELINFDTSITTRGFTGHEGLDAVGIVHMNGRIYDAVMGRFLQADPFVQDPFNSQSLNRYSYVLNNPLNTIDPSGYWAFLPALVGLLSSIGGAALIADGLVWAGMAVAFFGNAMAALMSGADLNDAFISGLSAAAFAYVGGNFNWAKAGNLDRAFKVLQFGSIGGITAVLQDRKFGHGFLSAGVGMAVGAKFFNGQGNAYNAIGRIVTGGTLSEATGGKFKNGARAAAFAIVVGGIVQGVKVWKGVVGVWKHIKILRNSKFKESAATGEGVLFVNGLNNTSHVANLKGEQQVPAGVTEFDILYNIHHGMIADLTESLLGKILGPSATANQLAGIIKTSNYTDVIAHSQGSIIVANALESLAMSGESFQGLNVIFNGGAAHYATTERLVTGNYGTFESFDRDNAHFFDLVPNVIGMNTWNPFSIIGSIIAAPLLFSRFSPHSDYSK